MVSTACNSAQIIKIDRCVSSVMITDVPPRFSASPCTFYGCCVVWNAGRRTESLIPLEDEDQTSEMVDGWKKINTLASYHMQDHSEIHLVCDKQRTNSVADGEPHIVRNADGTETH